MTADDALDLLIRHFAADWVQLSDPQVGDRLLADPVLVLGPDGTAPVPRAAFLAAIGARAAAVDDAAAGSETILTGVVGQQLGERVVVATIGWTFHHGTLVVPLVSDFLLLREAPDSLRCVAYLPRTNVVDHLSSQDS